VTSAAAARHCPADQQEVSTTKGWRNRCRAAAVGDQTNQAADVMPHTAIDLVGAIDEPDARCPAEPVTTRVSMSGQHL